MCSLDTFYLEKGFYPALNSDLQNNKIFRILAKESSRQNKYIQNATLNGKPWTKPWFSWNDIKNGGVLVLEMGSRPNFLWGAASGDAAPSGLN